MLCALISYIVFLCPKRDIFSFFRALCDLHFLHFTTFILDRNRLMYAGLHFYRGRIFLFFYFNDQNGTPKIFCSHFQKVKRGGRALYSQTHHSHCRIVQFSPIVQKLPLIFKKLPLLCKKIPLFKKIIATYL